MKLFYQFKINLFSKLTVGYLVDLEGVRYSIALHCFSSELVNVFVFLIDVLQ